MANAFILLNTIFIDAAKCGSEHPLQITVNEYKCAGGGGMYPPVSGMCCQLSVDILAAAVNGLESGSVKAADLSPRLGAANDELK